jgi:hypothetical protein
MPCILREDPYFRFSNFKIKILKSLLTDKRMLISLHALIPLCPCGTAGVGGDLHFCIYSVHKGTIFREQNIGGMQVTYDLTSPGELVPQKGGDEILSGKVTI